MPVRDLCLPQVKVGQSMAPAKVSQSAPNNLGFTQVEAPKRTHPQRYANPSSLIFVIDSVSVSIS